MDLGFRISYRWKKKVVVTQKQAEAINYRALIDLIVGSKFKHLKCKKCTYKFSHHSIYSLSSKFHLEIEYLIIL